MDTLTQRIGQELKRTEDSILVRLSTALARADQVLQVGFNKFKLQGTHEYFDACKSHFKTNIMTINDVQIQFEVYFFMTYMECLRIQAWYLSPDRTPQNYERMVTNVSAIEALSERDTYVALLEYALSCLVIIQSLNDI